MSDRKLQRLARELMLANPGMSYTTALRTVRYEPEALQLADSETRGERHSPLATQIELFRREVRYPRQEDEAQIGVRHELLATLTEQSLDSAIRNPQVAHVDVFRRIASHAYGGPGNQVQLNVHLGAGPDAIPPLARTIHHLLYGPGPEVDRLDDVLEHPAWKVRGFAEALAVKCLAIRFPDRWLPLFCYGGKSGKRAMMALPEIPIEPLDERGKSRAELAKESNDACRDLLSPYFGDDAWGPVVFLWWRLRRTAP